MIDIQFELDEMHRYLMNNKFPYYSVSVIYRQQDLGFHIFFVENVRNKITEDIREEIDRNDFSYSFVKE